MLIIEAGAFIMSVMSFTEQLHVRRGCEWGSDGSCVVRRVTGPAITERVYREDLSVQLRLHRE
jgi:hypothetical protein